MNSLHYDKILKRVTTRIWDTLSSRDRDLIANDLEKESAIAKWFYSTVAQETKAKYESPSYWLNDPWSFKTPQ